MGTPLDNCLNRINMIVFTFVCFGHQDNSASKEISGRRMNHGSGCGIRMIILESSSATGGRLHFSTSSSASGGLYSSTSSSASAGLSFSSRGNSALRAFSLSSSSAWAGLDFRNSSASQASQVSDTGNVSIGTPSIS